MLGDFLDLASVTSWLELLILIVELTMERSFSMGQVPLCPPFSTRDVSGLTFAEGHISAGWVVVFRALPG